MPRRGGAGRFPRQADSSSRVTPREISSRSKLLRERRFGTSSAARRCIRRRCPSRSTGNNTWRSRQGRRCLLSACHEGGAAAHSLKRVAGGEIGFIPTTPLKNKSETISFGRGGGAATATSSVNSEV